MEAHYDVFVIGAGPAGLTAALRLRQLGYSVMIAERSAGWPRKQIGEALTPGVQNIVALLDAHDALADVPHLARYPTRLLWRGPEPEMQPHAGSAIVDRASFDAGLLQLARQRGVRVELPAQVLQLEREDKAGDGWRLDLHGAGGVERLHARFILDASGRGAGPRLDCAPRLAAQWMECDQDGLPDSLLHATQTEALEHGWLWGASLPGGRYRVMLVCDPAAARQAMPGRPEARLRAACGGSRLFNALASHAGFGAVGMCSATPYVALDCWQPGRLKIGDAAFALDPVSSSGVEKAMRFSLQAAVAVHTLLSDDTPARAALTREFFEGRLIETCARHAYWTAASYGQAWCARQPFWRERSAMLAPAGDNPAWPGLHARLREAGDLLKDFEEPELKRLEDFDPRRALRLSGDASVVELPCVIEDQVRSHRALAHPHLVRPLAFLENEALFPHVENLRHAQPLDRVLRVFETGMPAPRAQQITAWLWQRGLLDSVSA
jgi:flavin-dependent dehydrogenase